MSEKLGVQGCLCSKANCLLNFSLFPGIGGWGLRRASCREARTLRRFRKDQGIPFSRGRRTLCFAGRGARPEHGLRPERARERRKKERKKKDALGLLSNTSVKVVTCDSSSRKHGSFIGDSDNKLGCLSYRESECC